MVEFRILRVKCLSKLTQKSMKNFDFLKGLSDLVELDLSHNKIASVGINLNTRLGNIKKLNLAGNELQSVEGILIPYISF